MTRRIACALFLLAQVTYAAQKFSTVVTVPRPATGEYFGLYLKGKKVGYIFSHLTLSPKKDKVIVVNEIHFKAKVGPNAISERHVVETRVYESKPRGRLLSFHMKHTGDGGNQTMLGTATAKHLTVLRKRPGKKDETHTLPAALERVEDADQPRVALARGQTVTGTVVNATDLKQYKVTTTLAGTQRRTRGGVDVLLRKAITISEKEKVPAHVLLDGRGHIHEVRFGPAMTAIAETEAMAKRVDLADVFALTRVELPHPLPLRRKIPGRLRFRFRGLPKKFRVNTYRQKFKALRGGGGAVEVTLAAFAPKVLKRRPLGDPQGGVNLESTIAVEVNDAAIQKLAKKIAGDERDAYRVAKRVNRWVHTNLVKDYGASSDRATGVLKRLRGDCTEHALLAVALLRALGIPAKRVDGLAYVASGEKKQALYWHEWIEAYVGEWTQMDPTFGQPIADATHFALGEEANAEITVLMGALQVLQVLP